MSSTDLYNVDANDLFFSPSLSLSFSVSFSFFSFTLMNAVIKWYEHVYNLLEEFNGIFPRNKKGRLLEKFFHG